MPSGGHLGAILGPSRDPLLSTVKNGLFQLNVWVRFVKKCYFTDYFLLVFQVPRFRPSKNTVKIHVFGKTLKIDKKKGVKKKTNKFTKFD